MFRTIGRSTLIIAILGLTCLTTRPAGAQQVGKPNKPLTEADIVGLIGQQADDRPILKRLDTIGIAFKMDDNTLTRIKQANPSPEVLARLARFLPAQAEAQPKVAQQLKTVAGKGKWEKQVSGVKEYLRDVAFIDEKIGVAVGDNATIVRTTDGGKTWKPVRETKPGERRHDFGKVLFSGPKEGWIVSGISNVILHSNDAGATWTSVKLPNPGGRFSLAGTHNCAHAASGSRYFYLCWGLSGSHLFQTDDAGGTWKELAKKIKVSAAGLSIPDGKHGVYAARIGTPSTGYLGQTTDGGATWQVQKANDGKLSSGNYARVQMVDKDHAWYLPHYGTIHATTDGGKTWTPQELGHYSTNDLLALHFLDAQRGHVLCGAYPGEVRRTTDGGKSWQPLGKLSNTDHLSSMSFPTMQHGWVVGDGGYIEHYTVETVARP